MTPNRKRVGRAHEAKSTNKASPDSHQQQTPLGDFGKLPLETRHHIYRDYFALFIHGIDDTGPTLLCTNLTMNSEAGPICTEVIRSSISLLVGREGVEEREEAAPEIRFDSQVLLDNGRHEPICAHNYFNGQSQVFLLDNTSRLRTVKHLDIQIPCLDRESWGPARQSIEETAKESEPVHISKLVSQMPQLQTLSMGLGLPPGVGGLALDFPESVLKPLLESMSVSYLEVKVFTCLCDGSMNDEHKVLKDEDFKPAFGTYLSMLNTVERAIKTVEYLKDEHYGKPRKTMVITF